MLKPVRQHMIFVAIFLCSLLILLALALYGAEVLSGERELVEGELLFSRLQVNLLGAGVFLLLSGFLPAYLALYFLFMPRLPQVRRILLSVFAFIASFAFLVVFIGDSIDCYDIWLFALGALSVVVSDSIAELSQKVLPARGR